MKESEKVKGTEANTEAGKNKSTAAPGGKQTPVEAATRTTGQRSAAQDTRPGAEPESPGAEGKPGAPNQGTESR
jgi:photosystem I subunit IV